MSLHILQTSFSNSVHLNFQLTRIGGFANRHWGIILQSMIDCKIQVFVCKVQIQVVNEKSFLQRKDTFFHNDQIQKQKIKK
jgi:hypothetical protein